MLKALLILASALFTVATAWALGALLLRRLKIRLFREEERYFALITGFALLSSVMFALASIHAVYNVVVLAAGLAAVATAWRLKLHRSEAAPLAALPTFWDRLFWIVYAVFAFLYVVHAMAPELSPDGSSYHLGLVYRYQRERGFVGLPGNMYASLTQGIELLFLFAFVLGRHSAAALVHCAFLLTLPLAILAYARRSGFPRAGVGAALFVFASPVVGIDGISAYNDVAVASILFACFYLLQVWDAERNNSLFIPIGLLAGFAFAAKYTAFLAIPYALGFVVWKLRSKPKELWRAAAVISVCVLVMVLPWLAKNALIAGNPFAPFLNGVFPNAYQDVAYERIYAKSMGFYQGLKSYAAIPLEVTVRGETLAGFLGPLFLLAPIALAALRWSIGRRLLFAALFFGSPFAANVGTRFLIPALPFVALAMAMALERIPGLLPTLILLHAITCWPSITRKYCDRWAWRLNSVPVKAALRIQSEDAFLTKEWPAYRVARMVDGKVPRGERVFSFSPVAEAYTSREIISGSYSTPNRALMETVWTPAVPGLRPGWGQRFQFSSRSLRGLRLVQSATDASDNWSINELYVLNGDTEVQRKPSWRVTSNPNWFEAGLAVDNNPTTRWSSRRTLEPGMYFQLSFDTPVTADSVLLRCVNDQSHAELRLEGQTMDGRWELLSEKPQQFELGPPLEMRRMAIGELLARGIHYLLVADFDVGTDEYFKNADRWGLKLIGEEFGTRLYEIKTVQR
jgi:hypothetical protein